MGMMATGLPLRGRPHPSWARNQPLAFVSCRQGRRAVQRSIWERGVFLWGTHDYLVTCCRWSKAQCKGARTGEVLLWDQWLFRRRRQTPRSPGPCCLVQTEQLGSNSEPDLHSIFEEGVQGWDGILSRGYGKRRAPNTTF